MRGLGRDVLNEVRATFGSSRNACQTPSKPLSRNGADRCVIYTILPVSTSPRSNISLQLLYSTGQLRRKIAVQCKQA